MVLCPLGAGSAGSAIVTRSGRITIAAAPRSEASRHSATTRWPRTVQLAMPETQSATSASKMLAEPRKLATYVVAGDA